MNIFIMIGLLFLSACLPESTELGEDRIECSLFASSNSLIYRLESESPLPSNLSIELEAGGNKVLVDECNTQVAGESSLFVDGDRSAAAAGFVLLNHQEVDEFYFPGGSKDPVADTAIFRIFKRESCSSELELVSERPNNIVTWIPYFAGRVECGKSSNSGYSATSLTP